MDLYNRLKELRIARNLTQEVLAEKVGVTRQTIISIEKGRFVPSVRLALLLAQALGSRLEEVFYLEPPKGDNA
jgi:putative transcriptional regulator